MWSLWRDSCVSSHNSEPQITQRTTPDWVAEPSNSVHSLSKSGLVHVINQWCLPCAHFHTVLTQWDTSGGCFEVLHERYYAVCGMKHSIGGGEFPLGEVPLSYLHSNVPLPPSGREDKEIHFSSSYLQQMTSVWPQACLHILVDMSRRRERITEWDKSVYFVFTCLISSVAVWHRDTEADIMKVLLQQLLNLTTTQLEDIDRDLREG